MATASTLLQHPRHKKHPLKPWDLSKGKVYPPCNLCFWKIWTDGYACVGCMFYTHRACAEAPPRIDIHPLHTDHTLTLLHSPQPFRCDACGENFPMTNTSFRCDECDFALDLGCALSTLSDRGEAQGKTPDQIKLPLHFHKLTFFSTRHEFVGNSNCVICKGSVERDGYMCLNRECEFLIHKTCVHDLFGDAHDINLDISRASSTLLDRGGSEQKTPKSKWIALPLHQHLLASFSSRYDFIWESRCVICKLSVEGDGYMCCHWECEFLIHKRCVPDLCYTDGTKAPQVYHRHPLETFGGEEDMATRRCTSCESEASSGEFIACVLCGVCYCRDCVQVPETIQYPHHPDHNLVLSIRWTNGQKLRSDLDELCYGCPSCEFFVNLRYALQVVAYCEEGMSAKINLSWHEHPLHLWHGTESDFDRCSYCEDKSDGPMYMCKHQDCDFCLHKRCFEIAHTIVHPHHPDHPLTLGNKDGFKRCQACSEAIYYLTYSCKLCAFFLHAKCALHVPTQKHSLHEHELLHLLEKVPSWKCNHCGDNLSSPFFRCVPCNFNLHEKCMNLPRQVLNSKVHWHPLILHETYIEDDSGEYYCDQCEQSRDVQFGAYVCLQCSAMWAYHIECVLPEFHNVFVKHPNAAEMERLVGDISVREEEVREAERKLNEMKKELDEQKKKLAALSIQ